MNLISESEIRNRCIQYLAETLNVPVERVDPAAKFARLGMDSAAKVFLLVELEKWLDVELSAEVVFEHQTINELARYLSKYQTGAVAPTSCA